MIMAFYLLKAAGTLAVAIVFAFCLPGSWRLLVRKRPRAYDPMKFAAMFLLLNMLWYQVRSWIFGAHLNVQGSVEIGWYSVAVVFTVVGAHIMLMTLRSYDRTERASEDPARGPR